jgi:hypothetical protein
MTTIGACSADRSLRLASFHRAAMFLAIGVSAMRSSYVFSQYVSAHMFQRGQ